MSDGQSTYFAIINEPLPKADANNGPAPKVGDTTTNSDGSKSTITGLTSMTIAGHNAARVDITVTTAGGSKLFIRRYVIELSDGLVVIDLQSTQNPPPFQPIENALMALPGSGASL